MKAPQDLGALSALESDHGCLAEAIPSGRCRSIAQWAEAGVLRVDGSALVQRSGSAARLDPGTTAALMMPAGPQGPAWLVTPNYQAIWRYNRADAYALAIGLLSDALRGGPLQRVAWPTDDPGLSRADFRELQSLLLRGGHCEVRVDGADGPRTSAAVREEETRRGWTPTGRGGGRLLAAMRADAGPAASCAPVAASAVGSSAPLHEQSPASAPMPALPASAPPVVPPTGRASSPS